ncbi:hypothetical protein ACHHYP_04133 [Achlya hypogyna]|uniref:Ankyrin repeat protein n=1 Tax=Achlya hypogyna TaxID=1202772 RepID=A0A1V9Z1Y5_ACHHY|nr:hypothetical protein ACHHYP_04133 [Achlya hypogyna]
MRTLDARKVRRRLNPASRFLDVFRTRELAAIIATYQIGLPMHLVPVLAELRRCVAPKAIHDWVCAYGRDGICQLLSHLTLPMGHALGRCLVMLGHDDLVEFIYTSCNLEPTAATLFAAAFQGNIRLVGFFYDRKVAVWGPGVFEAAACSGNVALLRFLEARQPEQRFNVKMLTNAVVHGHMPVVSFLANFKDEIGAADDALDAAAGLGRFDLFRYLTLHFRGSCSEAGFNLAVEKGHFALVFFIHHRNPLVATKTALAIAAARGHVAIVHFLLQQQVVRLCSSQVLVAAARGGHLALLEFLRSRSSDVWSSAVLDAAAEAGHLHVVQFLLAHRCRCTTLALDAAARRGHAGVVTLLLRHRKPCTEAAVVGAAWGGHRSILYQLLGSHAPVGMESVLAAARGGCVDLVCLLITAYNKGRDQMHAQLDPGLAEQMIAVAGSLGHTDVVTHVAQQCDPDWDQVLHLALAGGHLALVKHILDAKHVALQRAHLELAIDQRRMQVVAYLRPLARDNWIIRAILDGSKRRDRELLDVLAHDQRLLHLAMRRSLGFKRSWAEQRFLRIFATAPLPPLDALPFYSWFLPSPPQAVAKLSR